MDTVLNKVDAKGRVSLPSDYRAIVKETGSEIVCYRSPSAPCIEGCLEDLLDKLATQMED
jgi:DNA-binding transcriptional regulator/RsmH inhibitor MraZ